MGGERTTGWVENCDRAKSLWKIKEKIFHVWVGPQSWKYRTWIQPELLLQAEALYSQGHNRFQLQKLVFHLEFLSLTVLTSSALRKSPCCPRQRADVHPALHVITAVVFYSMHCPSPQQPPDHFTISTAVSGIKHP